VPCTWEFSSCTILDNTHLVCPKWARWILRAMITRTVMTMEATAVVGWRRGGGGDDACDDAGDGVSMRVAHIRGRVRACVCVCKRVRQRQPMITST